MSIRIHELAKELGLENKEMITLLKERKIIAPDVKSVSSTVDNINASALRDEFASKKPVAAPATAEAAPVKSGPPPVEHPADVPNTPPKVVIPTGVFVKSRQDLDRE